jgi:nucleotide-binding universal stress UspA family protein
MLSPGKEKRGVKLLLAIDGSDPSLTARDLVAGLRWPAGTAVHLIGAYQVPVDWTGGVGSTMDWVGDAEDAVRDELTELLRTAGQPLSQAGLDVEGHVVRGRAPDAILTAAAELGTDLVVTGSRGRGQIPSMLLGSVATEVATHAPCPVLVARGAAISHAVVGTDGSSSANAILAWLERAGILHGVPTDAVAVAIPASPGFELMVGLYTLGGEPLAEQRRALQARHQSDAEAMAAQLSAIGIPAAAILRTGDPAREILATAAERGADLIVTGSRGRGGLDRLLLGSVARNILVHAHCSALIVRSTPAAESGGTAA